MDLGIAGKVALVTGGSRGLGLACAERLAQEGCRVVIAARDPERLERVTQRLRQTGAEARGFSADISTREGIEKLASELKGHSLQPDILVFNNSGPPNPSFDDATDEDYLLAYRRMVMAFTWAVKSVLPTMKARRWGRIVTLGSYCVKEPHSELKLALHNLIRPAAVGLSKTISDEVGEFGITVNTIGTGTIDGGDEESTFRVNYRQRAAERGITFEEMKAIRVEPIPMKRAGEPAEVAGLCAYLASDLAGFITGQTVLIDGGKARSYL
jgi:3-oxoacyl-[acyl-carrier protein] reductase